MGHILYVVDLIKISLIVKSLLDIILVKEYFFLEFHYNHQKLKNFLLPLQGPNFLFDYALL